MGLEALLERARGVLGMGRPTTAAGLFLQADRFRQEGRYEAAAALVADGLRRSPNSAAGHVLAAYLHLVSREPALAREAFLRVLALDPDHPRALLGLARLAIEDGDAEAAGGYLRRALQYHPDFPEARALEEMVAGWAPGAPPAEDSTAPAAEALAMPPGARDLILAHADGAVVLARCDEARQPRLAQHLSRLTRIASATLGRAGLGALHQAVVEGTAETSYLRADGALVLSVTLPSSAPSAAGLAEADRLWAQARRHHPARDA